MDRAVRERVEREIDEEVKKRFPGAALILHSVIVEAVTRLHDSLTRFFLGG
jgi:hypothetical protein